MNSPLRTRLFLLLALVLAGCSSTVIYVTPREWSSTLRVDSLVASFRPALQGRRIFIDPGHGGDDRANRGPAEEAIEADVNLRVGLALRSYLQGAGATVLMSRDRDTTVALRDRPMMALLDSAEIFISLHHNATAVSDPSTNYAAVYYHAREGSAEFHPANHDLARYIQRDMSYAMRNPGAPFSPTFDGTLSDYDIYSNSGFAVLRQNLIPAVLIEASFHTHPPEEKRLAIEEFNRIEAWGIFLGVGKYFRAGIPTLALRSDSLVRIPRPPILVEAQPVLTLDRSSLRLFIDGNEVAARDTLTPGIVSMTLMRDLGSGTHQVSGWVRNMQGNFSWPFRRRIVAMLPATKLQLAFHPSTLPPSPLAATRLTIRTYDLHGQPVADGSTVRLLTRETRVDTILTTTGGAAVVYLSATNTPGHMTIRAESGKATGQTQVPIRRSGLRYLSGRVTSDTLGPIGGALMSIEYRTSSRTRDTLDVTSADGRYVAYGPLPDFFLLRAARAGYFVKEEMIQSVDPVTLHDISLVPVVDGSLFGKAYVLDARYGGMQTGDVAGMERSADINLAVALRLRELLGALGANVILMRKSDEMIPEAERARRSASLPRGTYLRIDASSPTSTVACEIYPNSANFIIGSVLLGGVAKVTGLDTSAVAGSSDPFYRNVAMSTVNVVIPSVTTGYYRPRAILGVDAIAWGILKGILDMEQYRPASMARFSVRSATGVPLSGVPAALDNTVMRYTDANGQVDFVGLERPGFVITTAENPDAVITRDP